MTSKVATLSPDDLRKRIDRLDRIRLAHLPTPLEELRRLSQSLGGPRIFVKRDDCTGLAFGGNKTRHNEFILGEAIAKGADTLVWGAGVQSNNCRQTAASCARLGLDCHLVLSRAAHNDDMQGNLLLDYLFGATYEIVDASLGPELDERLIESADRLRAQGKSVYTLAGKTVKARAALGYVVCLIELAEQFAALGVEPAAVYVCSAGATGAGLALANVAMGLDWKIRSIQPIAWPWDEAADAARVANEAAELLDLPIRLDAAEIDMTDAYIGKAYGCPTREGMDAIARVARTEGILLDPSYTGKAAAALFEDIARQRFVADQSVVFIHTGGTPALFAYRDELIEMVPRRVR